MKIAIAGVGYVGISLAVLLAQKNEVVAFDIDAKKINLLNNKKSPINDSKIQEFFNTKALNLSATSDKKNAYYNANFVIIAVPTDYDAKTNSFNTQTLESVVKDVLSINPKATIIIKSTIPIGYITNLKQKLCVNNIIFSPEFLREGQALYDNLYPSRIVIGEKSVRAEEFANLLIQGALKKDIPVLYTSSIEAEAIKLFANTFLAMRVAFFNELDTYAELNNLDSKQIIDGISLDSRIGNYYNNPSFGYGGYCLPKDTKQLLANYSDIPQNMISAIVQSNSTRMEFISNQVLKRNPKIVGMYRLNMKSGSDNSRFSASQGVINFLLKKNIKLLIYEPKIDRVDVNGAEVVNDFNKFIMYSDIILTNRMDDKLSPFADKVYCRDLFGKD